MSINTFPFLLFFVAIFILYWKMPKKFQWVLLLLAGYYFIASWKPAYVGLIILTSLINYVAARAMYASKRHKKQFLLLALLVDLGVLFIFKYFNFFALSIDWVFAIGHVNLRLPQFSLLLPIGISFYTFQTIGYMLDVYNGKIKPEKHFGYFSLFVCFFPQLSAGPIERASELLPQLKKTHTFQYSQVVSGLKLFAFGLFKKMVIADNLVIVVDRVFDSLPSYKGLSLIIAVILFSWQLYTDFSGYTDMVRGVARMLGFDLVQNFHFPYFATSLRDFWRRWHMSLSRWFRDYLYIPLGGNRHGLARTCLNVIIVFTLCGLWHGASWNFVLWGFFHGLVMSLERIVNAVTKSHFHVSTSIKIVYAYTVVCVSWVLFRAPTLPDAVYIFRYSLVGLKNFLSPAYVWATFNQLFVTNPVEIGITLGLLVIAISIDMISSRTSLSTILNRQPTVIRFIIYALLILMIIQVRNIDTKTFIYVTF